MTVDEKFLFCQQLMDLLEKILGPMAEVVLHDFRNMDRTIRDIRNSSVTGRTRDSGITDFALNIVKNMQQYDGQNGIYGYRTYAQDNRPLHSYSQFIRSQDGVIVGMLCVNVDILPFEKMKAVADYFFKEGGFGETEKEEPVKEQFTLSMQDMLRLKIDQVMSDFNSDVVRLTYDERKAVMAALDRQGVFLLKDAVTTVADRLQMSKASVYRYLKELNKA